MKIGVPVIQQIIQHRVKMLFRRIPRLQKVMMQLDDIYGLDGSFRVRIRREEHTLGVGIELHSLHQGLDPVHLRHAMID